MKSKLHKILAIGAIGFVLFVAPVMNPKEVEDLLRQVSVPKLAQSRRQQDYGSDGPPAGATLEGE